MTTDSPSSAPLVAICTPVYNGEKYLVETMECVQAQTYPNLVHVIVDNASTDATPEIIQRFRDGRVPLLVSRNSSTVPVSLNMNRAFDMAPGHAKYFCQLCADDLIYPEAMTRMVELLERDSDVGLVAASEANPMYQGWPAGDIFDGFEMVAAYFRDQLPTAFAHCLFRKDMHDARKPHFYDVNLNNNDVDAALWAMCRSKIGYLHEPLVFTREHGETETTREMNQAKLHYAEWLVMLDRYGALALGEKEARLLGRRFKRYYFRRLLRWRYVDGNIDLVRRHLERLDIADARPTLADYVDAMADWPLKALGLRQHWNLYPY